MKNTPIGGDISFTPCEHCGRLMIYAEVGDADSDESTLELYCSYCNMALSFDDMIDMIFDSVPERQIVIKNNKEEKENIKAIKEIPAFYEWICSNLFKALK